MSKAPAFQFYAQDFLTGVTYLTNEEIGMYIKMMCKQWTDGSIPKKRLGFLIGKEWNELSEELQRKFTEDGENLYNERLEEIRDEQGKRKQASRENGKKGGRPRKIKNLNKPNSNLDKSSSNEDEDRSMKYEEEKDSFEKSEKLLDIGPTFDEFWDAYDKKVGPKDKIKSKWNKLPRKTKEEIMEYIPRYKAANPDKKYRKNPETFFNNESWNDEIIVSGPLSKQYLANQQSQTFGHNR